MHADAELDLDEILDSTVNIPTVPSTLLELRKVCANDMSNANDIAAVIEHDPAIAAKVLRLVNSSFYARSIPVNAIPTACTVLGHAVIKNIVLQATVLDELTCDSDDSFDVDMLWDHSFKTAIGTQELVSASNLSIGMSRDDAYTCGLMHDVGKILIKESAPEKFAEALKISSDLEIPLYQAEECVFGFSHAEAGALLAERWQLSEELVNAIRYHHAGSVETEEQTLGLFVRAANSLAHRVSTARACWEPDVVEREVFEQLQIAEDQLQGIRETIAEAKLEN